MYRAEWGHLFRWSVPSDQIKPLVLTSGGQEQNEVIFSDEVYPQIRLNPWYWHLVAKSRMTSYFQIKCTLRWDVQSPTTPGQFDPPLLPQLNLVVLSPTTPGQINPPLLPQLNLVVLSPTTPGQFDPSPPSIELSGTELYYTKLVWPPPLPSLHWTEWYRALLHLVSLTPSPPSIERSHTEPYYTWSVWPSPSIELSGTEPYYTRSVWPLSLNGT